VSELAAGLERHELETTVRVLETICRRLDPVGTDRKE
jgi:hypothetical protein